MTEEEEQKLLAEWTPKLIILTQAYLSGRTMDDQTIFNLEQLLERFVRTIKRQTGADLGKLVTFVLPTVGFVHVTRADRTEKEIEALIRDVARLYPSVRPEELAHAVRRAFPSWRPKAKDIT